jgi:hypothetical protein
MSGAGILRLRMRLKPNPDASLTVTVPVGGVVEMPVPVFCIHFGAVRPCAALRRTESRQEINANSRSLDGAVAVAPACSG